MVVLVDAVHGGHFVHCTRPQLHRWLGETATAAQEVNSYSQRSEVRFTRLTYPHLTAFRPNRVRCDLVIAATVNGVVRCEATQFAVAATNHSALGSDETRSVKMRSDEVR